VSYYPYRRARTNSVAASWPQTTKNAERKASMGNTGFICATAALRAFQWRPVVERSILGTTQLSSPPGIYDRFKSHLSIRNVRLWCQFDRTIPLWERYALRDGARPTLRTDAARGAPRYSFRPATPRRACPFGAGMDWLSVHSSARRSHILAQIVRRYSSSHKLATLLDYYLKFSSKAPCR
jgi:hypothetical protein